MSFFSPTRQTRTNIKFYAELLQAAAIIFTGVWAAFTYHHQTQDQKKRAIEQAEAVKRELRKPYDEKQLSLYLETARVVADLATLPQGDERERVERRFWELYWGELAFVESSVSGWALNDEPVEQMMRQFCDRMFETSKCVTAGDDRLSDALHFSRQASDEIKERWGGYRRLGDGYMGDSHTPKEK
jgi:hypothetical protein